MTGPSRRLALRTERLSELTPAQLESVHGGLPTDICYELPTFVVCTVIVTVVVSKVLTTTNE